MKKLALLFSACACASFGQVLSSPGGGVGVSGPNPTASSAGAVTSLAITITSLNLTTIDPASVFCYTGTTTRTPFTAYTFTTSGSNPITTVTVAFSSTANITCGVNATGGAGAAGANGSNGSTWSQGSGAPSDGSGNNGDFYFRTATSDVYQKASGTWGSPIANIKGATGATGSTGAAGSNGSNGSNGNSVLNGSGAPGSGTGGNGDFYVDTSGGSYVIYGPKSGGAWGSGTTLTGGGVSSIFDGSKATNSGSCGGTPTFDLIKSSNQNTVRFECTLSANITGVTFSHPSSGAKFSVALTQAAGAYTAKSGFATAASNVCEVSLTNGKVTTMKFEVAADSTTVVGVGCGSDDAADTPMTGPASSTAHDVMSFSDTTGKASEDTGFLASNVVRKDAANTFGAAGTLDLSSSTAAAALRMPNKAGAAPTTAGAFEYDTTNKNVHVGANSVDNVAALFPAASLPTDGNCVKASVTSSVVRLADAGAACGSGGVTTINGAGSTTQLATEAVIATISMPAMGTNNACHISADFTKTGTASTWGLLVRLTNTSGAVFASAPPSIANTAIAVNLEMDIKNTGSASQLISGYWTTSTTGGGSFALYAIDGGATGRTILPQTANLASPWTLVLTALSGSAMTDTIKSETYNVRCQ